MIFLDKIELQVHNYILFMFQFKTVKMIGRIISSS